LQSRTAIASENVSYSSTTVGKKIAMGFKVKPRHIVKALKVASKAAPVACKIVETAYPPSKAVTGTVKIVAKAGRAIL
jgi:hypothetical protein